MIVDIHVHIGGVQKHKTGCFMTPEQVERLRKELPPKLRFKLRIAEWLGILDSQVQKRVVGFIEEAHELDYAVLLPMDGVYDREGRLDEERTTFYVPNSHVLATAKLSRKIIPACSVNPMRRDWEEELERCVESGARLVKWLPPSMQFDPSEERFKPFYRKLAALKLPLLSHTGWEHTILSADGEALQSLAEPKRLKNALEAGVTVIMAHSGTSGGPGEPDWFDQFSEMIKVYPHLYGDTAAFTHWTRAHLMKKILDTPDVMERFIHGSDATLQPSLDALKGMVSQELLDQMSKMENPLIKDLRLKRALGFPPEVFERATKVLNLSSSAPQALPA